MVLMPVVLSLLLLSLLIEAAVSALIPHGDEVPLTRFDL